VLKSLRAVRRGAAIATAILIAATVFVSAGNGAATKEPFVTAKVPLKQTVRKLIRGRFTQTVTCRDSCQVIARVFITAQVARKLGFKGVKAGKPYAIALKQVRLAGEKPTRVRMKLGQEARKRLPRWKQALRLTGETYASSRSSDDRGQATWVTLLRR
jgi:hypothetical protein